MKGNECYNIVSVQYEMYFDMAAAGSYHSG